MVNGSTETPHSHTDESLSGSSTAAPDEHNMQNNSPEENAKPSLFTIATDALTVARSFMDLALMEVGLAAQAIPRLIGVAIIGIFLALFAWLSLSVFIGWLAYYFFGSIGWGIGGFFILQIFALFACKIVSDMYVRRLTLPHARSFIKNTGERLYDAINRD